MKKTWFEAYVKIDNEKQLHCFGEKCQRKFKTYEEAQQAILKTKKAYEKKDTTMKRNGNVYNVSLSDVHDVMYSIARFEADVDESIYLSTSANEQLKEMYNNKSVVTELHI